ncbi:MAG: hypothetical protein K2M19_03305 [Muribaculaceae bacterium]|nr:hypothetical protein [Muribaculaceae bacterium]
MIKTGLQLPAGSGPEIVRLLLRHPDVDLRWVSANAMPPEGVTALFDAIQGESTPISPVPDFENIDLYIGPDTAALDRFLGQNVRAKAILTNMMMRPVDASDGVPGVCEFNRKALVRGARVALQPDITTLLGALALMPLAKNLLLNTPVTGTMLLPGRTGTSIRVPAATLPPLDFKVLRENILAHLQQSFSAPIEITSVEHSDTFACAILTIDVRMALDQIRRIYTEFYADHRHIFFPTRTITREMVTGTNKTAISLGHDGLGRLIVTAAFDSRYKAGAGNVIHMLNLLFGLDELTGF